MMYQKCHECDETINLETDDYKSIDEVVYHANCYTFGIHGENVTATSAKELVETIQDLIAEDNRLERENGDITFAQEAWGKEIITRFAEKLRFALEGKHINNDPLDRSTEGDKV